MEGAAGVKASPLQRVGVFQPPVSRHDEVLHPDSEIMGELFGL
jgi:hypothetical protein